MYQQPEDCLQDSLDPALAKQLSYLRALNLRNKIIAKNSFDLPMLTLKPGLDLLPTGFWRVSSQALNISSLIYAKRVQFLENQFMSLNRHSSFSSNQPKCKKNATQVEGRRLDKHLTQPAKFDLEIEQNDQLLGMSRRVFDMRRAKYLLSTLGTDPHLCLIFADSTQLAPARLHTSCTLNFEVHARQSQQFNRLEQLPELQQFQPVYCEVLPVWNEECLTQAYLSQPGFVDESSAVQPSAKIQHQQHVPKQVKKKMFVDFQQGLCLDLDLLIGIAPKQRKKKTAKIQSTPFLDNQVQRTKMTEVDRYFLLQQVPNLTVWQKSALPKRQQNSQAQQFSFDYQQASQFIMEKQQQSSLSMMPEQMRWAECAKGSHKTVTQLKAAMELTRAEKPGASRFSQYLVGGASVQLNFLAFLHVANKFRLQLQEAGCQKDILIVNSH